MQVWLNGTFVERDEARVSAFDAGFQHGVGLFETMLARNGSVFRVEAHVQRLIESAKTLRLSESLRHDPLCEAVELTVRRNQFQDARVRLTITGGDLNFLQSTGRSHIDPTIMVVAQPPTPYPDEFFEKGVRVMLAPTRANPFDRTAGHKTLNYWPRIQMLQEAAQVKAAEALWLDMNAQVTGGCVSNIFVVKDGELFTPSARGEEEEGMEPSSVLPGITRAAILELADAAHLHAEKCLIGPQLVFDADEVFLTNSSWGVLPVIAVESKQVGNGEVGRFTNELRQAWCELVDEETA